MEIANFIACVRAKGHSYYTARNYKAALTRLKNWKGEREIDLRLVEEYRIHLSKTVGLKTQGMHLVALRSYLKWCWLNDVPCLNYKKIEVPKAPQKLIEVLDIQEVFKLMDFPVSNLRDIRDRALLEFIFSTGMRVGEVVRLDRASVNMETGAFQIVGKGGKRRMVVINERAKHWLKIWLEMRTDQSKALFVNLRFSSCPTVDISEKMRISTVSVQAIVRQRTKEAGIQKKVTPHVLRHSFSTILLCKGAEIRTLQEMLGHASILTTQGYLHVSNQRVADTHALLP